VPSDKFAVLVSPQADRKLASHIHFLARVSEPAAGCLYDAYEEALGSLAENPFGYLRYEPHSEIAAELHAKFLAKRYRIVFEIRDDAVYVYDIQDCRQDIDKNLV
jgi:hypothetical protein